MNGSFAFLLDQLVDLKGTKQDATALSDGCELAVSAFSTLMDVYTYLREQLQPPRAGPSL